MPDKGWWFVIFNIFGRLQETLIVDGIQHDRILTIRDDGKTAWHSAER